MQKNKILIISIILLILIILASFIGIRHTNIGSIFQNKSQLQEQVRQDIELVLNDIKTEYGERLTLDNITEEELENRLTGYEITIEDTGDLGKYIILSKDGNKQKITLDSNVDIQNIEDISKLEIKYEVKELKENNVIAVLVKMINNDGTIKEIINSRGEKIQANGKEKVAIDLNAQKGTEYRYKVQATDGTEKEKIIKLDEYYYKVSRKLNQNIYLTNKDVKAAKGKTYETEIKTTGPEFSTRNIIVTMNKEDITQTAVINGNKIRIENATGPIDIRIGEGFVDYWKFNGSLSNEISGKQDMVINKGTPEFQEDGSVYLNNAIIKTNGNYSLSSNFTIEIQAKLVKAFPCRDNSNPIIGVGQTAAYVGGTCVAVWWSNNGSFAISNGLGDSYSRGESAGSSSSNTWYTLVLRYNGTKLELFKDGQRILETNGVSLKDTPLYLGGLPTNHPSHFGESAVEGYFKNLCVYDRALSDEEISDL